MPRKPNSWVPILHGDGETRARLVVKAIEAQIDASPHRNNPNLSGGMAGVVVFHAFLALIAKTKAEQIHHREKVGEFLESAQQYLPKIQDDCCLYSGYTGLSWVVDRLVEWGLVDSSPKDDLNEEVDARLLKDLAQPSENWVGKTELIYGLAGIGVYLLGRPDCKRIRPHLVRVIDHLEAVATIDESGCTWFTPPERMHPVQRKNCPSGWFNMGLSHGLPGAMVFLAQAAQAGIPKAETLARGAASWLVRQARDYPSGTRFSTFIPKDGNEPNGCRVAWCYGDLGISIALLQTGIALSDPGIKHYAIEIANNLLKKPISAWQIQDQGLCHGMSGNAHIFNRLFQSTGIEAFGILAKEAFMATLDAWDPQKNGYSNYSPVVPNDLENPKNWLFKPTSILEGSCGIAMALASSFSYNIPCWDAFLMTNLPFGHNK